MASSAARPEKRPTFTQFLITEHRRVAQQKNAVSGEFTLLLNDIVSACKVISMFVAKGPKLGVLGSAGTFNTSDEQQKTLDVLSNDVFISSNEYNGCLSGMVSEELEQPYQIPAEYPKGRYLLCFDPLDGSSNIEVNVSIGTIFSIWRAPETYDPKTNITADAFLQAGAKQVAAGYCVYGPQTTLVLSTGNGVNGFTLDSDVGEFYLSDPDMKIPKSCREYSINQSNRRFWEPPVLACVEQWEAGDSGPCGKDYTMRWVGSMVSDVHRIMSRGGIFCYPLDSNLVKKGLTGRLRYLYEVAPMAFLVEQAGGGASTGLIDALDWIPVDIHQRAPIFLGSKEEVDRMNSHYKEWEKNGKPPRQPLKSSQ